MRFFDNLHPAVSMAYFVLVLVLTLICMHPVMVVLSFLGASWFSIRLRGLKLYGRTMCFVGPMFILIALANPLFNHRGVTPLFEINHLWYTLEATIYGLVSACSLCSVVIWFTCYQKVMTSDKFLNSTSDHYDTAVHPATAAEPKGDQTGAGDAERKGNEVVPETRHGT